MREPLLLLDTNYLCHRAYHAMESLSHEDRGTGAIFGVLRDIVTLQNGFKTRRCVFAFDLGRGKRQNLMPEYKASRRKRHTEASEEEQIARNEFQRQVEELRRWYLPAAGFKNVFAAAGYEADDIIARIADNLDARDEAIIIGSDHDLWQCLRPNVWMWNPQTQKPYTVEIFEREWGLKPHHWADVKAYAGCNTDDVPGIQSIGETTAAKYLRNELGEHTKAYTRLKAGGLVHRKNIPVVLLPFPGTPEFEIQQDEVTEDKWHALVDDLGMKTLRDAVPYGIETKSKGRKRGKKEGFGF